MVHFFWGAKRKAPHRVCFLQLASPGENGQRHRTVMHEKCWTPIRQSNNVVQGVSVVGLPGKRRRPSWEAADSFLHLDPSNLTSTPRRTPTPRHPLPPVLSPLTCTQRKWWKTFTRRCKWLTSFNHFHFQDDISKGRGKSKT